MKKLLTVILVIILLGAAIGGFLIYRHTSTTIGNEVSFESAAGEFEYRIDARTGAVLSVRAD